MDKQKETLLKNFEEATARVSKLESQLVDALEYRNFLRKQVRAALQGINPEVEEKPQKVIAREAKEVPSSIKATVQAVHYIGQPVKAPELAKLLKIDETAARNRLQRATELGLLERTGRGLYGAVNTNGTTESDMKQE